jgi:KDO2-lipid IV(A) lauroyltransferase
VRLNGDVRLGGEWTALQRAKNDVLWLVASAALAAVRPLSVGTLRRLGRTLGYAAHALAFRARSIALANVARVYPTAPPATRESLVRRCFATLGEALAETVASLGTGRDLPPLPLADDARDTLAAARAAGRGVVFVSAHLGAWERVAASLVASGVPLVTLARESYDPRFSRLYERLRAAHGVRVIWRSAPGAATRIVRTLRAGGVLGVPMDLRARVRSCAAPFLGHPAATPIGPALIALKTGAPVVVGTLAPGGPGPSHPRITATRIDAAGLVAGDGGARELTARINAELSRRILAFPEGWVWMHERWRPEEEYDGDDCVSPAQPGAVDTT